MKTLVPSSQVESCETSVYLSRLWKTVEAQGDSFQADVRFQISQTVHLWPCVENSYVDKHEQWCELVTSCPVKRHDLVAF